MTKNILSTSAKISAKKFFPSLLGFGVLTMVASSSLGFVSTQAQETQNSSSLSSNSTRQAPFGQKRGFKKGQKTLLTMDQNIDFNTWKSQIEGTPMAGDLLAKINEGNFARFKEMLKLKQEGNKTEAQAIAQELSLQDIKMGKMGKGRGEFLTPETREALENKDYEAWKNSLTETQQAQDLLVKIDTGEKFDKLSEAHSYQQKARQIQEELGLKPVKSSIPSSSNDSTGN